MDVEALRGHEERLYAVLATLRASVAGLRAAGLEREAAALSSAHDVMRSVWSDVYETVIAVEDPERATRRQRFMTTDDESTLAVVAGVAS